MKILRIPSVKPKLATTLTLVVFFWISGISPRARAEIPTRIEPAYADAILAYNSRDLNRSLKLIDDLLQQYPAILEFLELKALILKSLNSTEKSVETYRRLIDASRAAGKSEKELAGYHFELGLTYFKNKQYSEARPELKLAADSGFNAPSSHFFMGMMDFQENRLDAAELNFSATASSDVAELRPAASFYLGQIQAKLSNSSGATQYFLDARKTSAQAVASPKTDPEAKKVAVQIRNAADQALKPFDQSGWFANLGLMMGYDSNAISTPGTSPSGLGATVKATLQGGVGYATSPLNTYQWVPSYRTSYNYNFAGANTLQGEFFSHDFSLYLTRNALARTSYGFKVEPIYTFQDQPNSDSSGVLSRHYGGYSFAVPFGPYLRWDFKPHWSLNAEFYLSPGKYLTDDPTNSPTLQRSGLDYNLRWTVRNERGSRYFNPSGALILDLNSTKGDQFSSKGGTLELADSLRLSERLNLNLTLDLGTSSFANATNSDATITGRKDKLVVIDLSTSYRVNAKYSLLAVVNYTSNSSDDASYQYTRGTFSLGGSYTF